MTRRFPFDDLGQRLRAAREERGMSLRSLASAIGVSPSLLSQVEIGKTIPSVNTLYALVSRLDVSTDALLGREDRGCSPSGCASELHASASPAPGLHLLGEGDADSGGAEGRNGVRWERLAIWEEAGIEALRGTYQPCGSSSVEGRLVHRSGIEHVYLISGELTLHLGFDARVIRAGESVVFESQRPHLFVNQADAPAIGIWHITARHAAPQPPDAPREEAQGSPTARIAPALAAVPLRG